MTNKKEIIVVKVGSHHNTDAGKFAKDISKYCQDKDTHVIVVHGGNYELTKWLTEKIPEEDHIIYSEHGQKSRLTKNKVIEGLYMVYCGKRNKELVAELQKKGVNAIGLSGIDAQLISGKKHPYTRYIDKNGKKIVTRDDLTGKITGINKSFLKLLLKEGMTPVITPPAFDPDLKKAINVDGDKVTIKIAEEMKADKVLFLFEAAGFMEKGSLLKKIKKGDLKKHLPNAKDGMKKKLLSVIKLCKTSSKTEIIFSSFEGDTPFTDAIKHEKGTLIY